MQCKRKKVSVGTPFSAKMGVAQQQQETNKTVIGSPSGDYP